MMTSDDENEERLLDHARRAFAPKAGDAGRVFDAVSASIAAGGAAAAVMDAAVHAARPAAVAPFVTRGVVMRAIAALAVVGASSAAGYIAGYRAGRASAERATATQPARPAAADRTTARPLAAPATPDLAVDVPQPVPSGVPSTAPRAGHRVAPRDGSGMPSSAQTLEREVQMMKRIEHALREQNPQQALVLLGQLDREIPGGQLAEERLAVFARARCGLGLGSPAAIAREFAQKYPKSVYFARVRQACAEGEDPPVPFD